MRVIPIIKFNPTVSDLDISSDGKYIFVLDITNDRIQKYELTTPWDLSTIRGIEPLLQISYEDGAPRGFEFSSDGRAVFVTGDTLMLFNTLLKNHMI